MSMEEKNNPDSPQNEVADIFKQKDKNTKAQSAETPTETATDNKKTDHSEDEKTVVTPQEGGKLISFILDIALNLLIVFGLVFIIQTFIASPFKVYGPSMCDTLNIINEECQGGYGEYIIVNKLIYLDFFGWSLSEPKRGDIIVFHPPHSKEQFYIKRIIGIPGDTIKLIDGDVYLFNKHYPTGLAIPEPYLSEENKGETNSSTNRVTTFTVPDNEYFVMGDNRNKSTDSRSCFRDAFQGGCRGEEEYFLPRENIEGKAWIVLWPFKSIRIIKEFDYY